MALRYFICLTFFALSVLLTGCAEPSSDLLRFGLSRAPITLDPRFATDAASSRINRLIYQRLVDFDEHYQMVPSLTTWQQLSPTHYRFSLDGETTRFHDGSALTTTDIKATYDSLLDPETASPHQAPLAVIAEMVIVDERQIDFILNEVDPLFPGRLVIGILPEERIAAAHPFNKQPLGSGPYRFSAWPEEGRLKLQRLRDGQRLEFIEVKSPTVRVLKLLRGEIDMLQNDLPSELVTYLAEQPELELTRGQGSNFTYLGFNLNDTVSGEHKLRQAIAYALDREAIIRYVLGGAALPASALLPPDHWAGSALPLYPYDPAQARALLAEAGFGEGQRVQLTYKTSSDPFRVRLATIIQSQLAEVGIDVDLRSYDWGTFYGDIKAGRFQMYSLSWVGIKTPDIFRYVFHSSAVPPNGANRGRYSDTVADRLIETAEAATTLEGQVEPYRQLQAHLLETLPYVPLWYENHLFAARQGITGYTVARDGNYDGLIQVERR